MIKMMNSVVENGTGKRAALDGIPVAGKTGTTNAGATPGSSATPAISPARSGWATTIIRRPNA
jgi:membrane peptidoglycan carboxypeptidase